VNDVVFANNGQYLATADQNGTILLWIISVNQDSIMFHKDLYGHTGSVNGLAFSPDGAYLASVSSDGTAKVWQTSSGKLHAVITGWRTYNFQALQRSDEKSLYDVVFSFDGKRLIITGQDETVKVWDIASGKHLFTLSGHTSAVTGVVVSPNGEHLVTASLDKTVKVWDIASGKHLFTLSGHTSAITDVAISPDGGRVVTASLDSTVKVWDFATGNEVFTLPQYADAINGVAFSPDGKYLAVACRDGSVRLCLIRLSDLMEVAKTRVFRVLSDDECETYLHIK
jgi:WD40 repeat protein